MTNKLPRLLFSLPFIILGSMHFINAPAMAGLVPTFVPGAIFWVYFTGICLVAAGISLNIGKKDGLAMKLLAVLLITFTLRFCIFSFLRVRPRVRPIGRCYRVTLAIFFFSKV